MRALPIHHPRNLTFYWISIIFMMISAFFIHRDPGSPIGWSSLGTGLVAGGIGLRSTYEETCRRGNWEWKVAFFFSGGILLIHGSPSIVRAVSGNGLVGPSLGLTILHVALLTTGGILCLLGGLFHFAETE